MKDTLMFILKCYAYAITIGAVVILLASCSSPPCPKTEVFNMSTLAWTDKDKAILGFNKGFCERKFGPAKVCLKKFYKTGNQSYHIICGGKTNER